MSFQDLGYAASNELSPDAWKEYMLGNLAKQDAYQQTRMNQYVELQERMKAKAKREALVAGIKSGLQFGIQKAMTPKEETTENRLSFDDQMSLSTQPGIQPVKWPWENK